MVACAASLTVGYHRASHGALHGSTVESPLSSDALALSLHRAQLAHSWIDSVQQQYCQPAIRNSSQRTDDSFNSPFPELRANSFRCPVSLAAMACQQAVHKDRSIQQLKALPKIGRRNGEPIDNLNIIAWWWESEI